MQGRLLPTAPEGTDVQLVVAVPTAFDYLDPHAVSLLLDTVHHEYDRRVPEYLGNVIAGSFQDELPGTNSWSHRFPASSAPAAATTSSTISPPSSAR